MLRSRINMSQKLLLVFVAIGSIFLPSFSGYTGFSTPLLFSTLAFVSVWGQEIFVIQLHYRSENVDFTRRFYAKYPRFPRINDSVYTHFIGFFIIRFDSPEAWFFARDRGHDCSHPCTSYHGTSL